MINLTKEKKNNPSRMIRERLTKSAIKKLDVNPMTNPKYNPRKLSSYAQSRKSFK